MISQNSITLYHRIDIIQVFWILKSDHGIQIGLSRFQRMCYQALPERWAS